MEFTFGPWAEGIDEKAEPGTLGPGELRAAVNVLLDETPGQVGKRLGNTQVALLPSGESPKFGYVFKKNDGTEYLLLSDGAKIYVTTDLVTFTLLVSALDDTAYLQFETAENKCWITNGTDATMWFDGTTLVVMDREYPAASAAEATADAGTDTTHIVDAALTSAVTDYWKDRRVVITSGPAVGAEALVTAFDPATDKLTITPAITGLTTAAGYRVGRIMPKGRIIRYAQGSLFIGGTSENRSEIRFSRPDNPDDGTQMSLDNPSAWPSNYQISITQDDGDQVWTFSPTYRNRVLVTKGTAIYRIEPDSTRQFVPVLVSQEVGCRYPDSWAVKDELLHFMGNERSGLMDLYVTDMVSVKPRHKDGKLLPSFADLQRSEPTYRYIARGSADDFNTGAKATLCETGNNRLECRVINTKSAWDEVAATKVDAAASVALDSVTIDGVPAWPTKYEANALPPAATPAWTKWVNGTVSEAILAGKLVNEKTASFAGNGIAYYKDGILDSSKNTFVAFRVSHSVVGLLNTAINIVLQNGTKQVKVTFFDYNGQTSLYINGTLIQAQDISGYVIGHALLDKDGNGSVYINGARVWTGAAIAAAPATTVPAPAYALNTLAYHVFTGNICVTSLDYIYEDLDFAYTAAQLGATIPTVGTVTVKINYTRAPDKFGKYFFITEVEAT